MLSEAEEKRIPERIRGLVDLAHNLWWTWHPRARRLFRALDYQAWRESTHNPVLMLRLIQPARFVEASQDPEFLALYDEVMAEYQADLSRPSLDFPGPIAYFCAEFGVHVSLPIYAGGLGILAGDTLKEASDMALPMVGVGLVYSQGYVTQRIREDGWPEDVHQVLDHSAHPLQPVLTAQGRPLTLSIPAFDPPLKARVFQARIGRIPLFLLTTDVEENAPWDRAISQQLYTTDLEQRLKQEWVLGVGGMRALKEMGISPAVLHLNEGHPAFALLERIRQFMDEGLSFAQAIQRARETTIFTTHTPLPAGTDVFPFSLLDRYLTPYCQAHGLPREALLELGTHPKDPGAGFNMTVFALRLSRYVNGVSQKHAEVARKIWGGISFRGEEVNIEAITNGIHLFTWIEPLRVQRLLDKYLGSDWRESPDDPAVWERVEKIPDEELWAVHLERKEALISELAARARKRWQQGAPAANILAFGSLLDPHALTLGFARRFTAYKRPDLLLYDLERLRKLVTDPLRPVQIIFAGKAHPADIEGKRLIQKVFRLAKDPNFAGRIAFAEEYDQHLARFLVAGVDVWVNTPLPPLEASGTSGMKASVNGVPHLSILDGWWLEGYTGTNGWGFGEGEIPGDRNACDAGNLYRLLEDRVIPLYYERGPDGIPHGFVRMMKEAMKTVAPRFCTRRMLREYLEKFYKPAAVRTEVP
ncbi:MAG: alpha-glucan family phosphorylase [Candidatus Bipolaricaulota bacterium]|nr:alpha-glucan family phosphorylase [Candidatus Bipolaricaulota bacterium]MDW8127274.1 alpha-glucan family phosphorylase [Candidatus Bipolaricaulota bacterium]